jgi:hypothetical protein
MDASHQRLQLANKIHLQMLRERRSGIDVKRMLNHALYAHEVVRHCEGANSEALPLLAARWRMLEEARQLRAAAEQVRREQGLDIDLSLPPAFWRH